MKKVFCFIFIATFCSAVYAAEPYFEFQLSQNILKQGDTVRLDIISNKPIEKISAKFSKRDIQFFKYNLSGKKSLKNRFADRFYAFWGIDRYLMPGIYHLKVAITLKNKYKFYKKIELKIEDAHFKSSSIKFTKKKTKLLTDRKALSREVHLFGKKFRSLHKKPYFYSNFRMPAKGRVSSEFGKYRKYNGKMSAKHSGVDISNKKGTFVRAANRGKVLVSKGFKCHGNTVLIDHGLGILSIYFHLGERWVKQNQIVKKGQIIGRMGNTGISTGTHLHWGLSVQNVRVDPLFWLEHPFLYE